MADISLATHFRLYYTPKEDGVTKVQDVPIIAIDPNYEQDIIAYHYQFYIENITGKVRFTGREPIAYSYISTERYIVKLLRPSGVDKLELVKDEEVLDTYIYFEVDPITKVVSYAPDYYFWSILRFNYALEESDNTEVEIHEFTRDSHYTKMRYTFTECTDASMIRKEFINGLFSNVKSEVVNGNLLTKSYQIFHLGSLIRDIDNMEN